MPILVRPLILALVALAAASSCSYRYHLPRVPVNGSIIDVVEMEVGERRKVLTRIRPKDLYLKDPGPAFGAIGISDTTVIELDFSEVTSRSVWIMAVAPGRAVIAYSPIDEPTSLITEIRVGTPDARRAPPRSPSRPQLP